MLPAPLCTPFLSTLEMSEGTEEGASATSRDPHVERWREVVERCLGHGDWAKAAQEPELLRGLGALLMAWSRWPLDLGLVILVRQRGSGAEETDRVAFAHAADYRHLEIRCHREPGGGVVLQVKLAPPAGMGADTGEPGRPGIQPALVRGPAPCSFFDAIAVGMAMEAKSRRARPDLGNGLAVRTGLREALRLHMPAGLPSPPAVDWHRRETGRQSPGCASRSTTRSGNIGAGWVPALGGGIPWQARVEALAQVLRSGGWSAVATKALPHLLVRLPAGDPAALFSAQFNLERSSGIRRYRCAPLMGGGHTPKVFEHADGQFTGRCGLRGGGQDTFLHAYSTISNFAWEVEPLRHRLAGFVEANVLHAGLAVVIAEAGLGGPDRDGMFRRCWGEEGLTWEGQQVLEPDRGRRRALSLVQLTALLDRTQGTSVCWRQYFHQEGYDLVSAIHLPRYLPTDLKLRLLREDMARLLYVHGSLGRINDDLQTRQSNLIWKSFSAGEKAAVRERVERHVAASLLRPVAGEPRPGCAD